METVSFQVTREHAAKLYRKYRSHCAYSTPMDDEIRRVYHQLSKGKTVIRALASIAAAGVDENGLPKLAITRADAQFCNLSLMPSGSASMTDYAGWYRSNMSRNRFFSFPDNTFPRRARHVRARAVVPHIPPDIRPRRGLENYHILWEAEWGQAAPVDPYLLRRLGRGDAWLVCGAWDLTDVERAVLEQHTFGRP